MQSSQGCSCPVLTTTIDLGLWTHGRHGEELGACPSCRQCRGQYRPRVQQRFLAAASKHHEASHRPGWDNIQDASYGSPPRQDRMKEDPVMKWQHDARTQIVHRGDLAIKSPAVARLLARDLRSAIAPGAGRSRPARLVPPRRTRCRPGPCPAADIMLRSPATAHRSPERCE